jgi:hypothetical protein
MLTFKQVKMTTANGHKYWRGAWITLPRSKIKQWVISKKVLVVVDDVDKAENLTSLQLLIEKATKNVASQSKILMNCQNWQILNIM